MDNNNDILSFRVHAILEGLNENVEVRNTDSLWEVLDPEDPDIVHDLVNDLEVEFETDGFEALRIHTCNTVEHLVNYVSEIVLGENNE